MGKKKAGLIAAWIAIGVAVGIAAHQLAIWIAVGVIIGAFSAGALRRKQDREGSR